MNFFKYFGILSDRFLWRTHTRARKTREVNDINSQAVSAGLPAICVVCCARKPWSIESRANSDVHLPYFTILVRVWMPRKTSKGNNFNAFFPVSSCLYLFIHSHSFIHAFVRSIDRSFAVQNKNIVLPVNYVAMMTAITMAWTVNIYFPRDIFLSLLLF